MVSNKFREHIQVKLGNPDMLDQPILNDNDILQDIHNNLLFYDSHLGT